MNGKSSDFSRSAWVGRGTRDYADIDIAGLDGELTQRLGWAGRSIELPPGRYETILPPTAVADLMFYLYVSAGAQDADDGRTVFSKAGGGTRIGERLATTPVTLRSNPAEPGLECEPFVTATASFGGLMSVFDNGYPIRPTEWIEAGGLGELIRTRAWAAKTGAQPAPITRTTCCWRRRGRHRRLAGDDLPDRARPAAHLPLVTRIREVDPRTLLLTGLTRDGVYRVEGGEVTGAVNNFRWNESPVDLLGRLGEVGRSRRCLPREWSDYFTRTAMPALRIPDFNMSTVSQAVLRPAPARLDAGRAGASRRQRAQTRTTV